ncbi:MAG: hypothetical protein WBQ34_02270 [Candidatus Acidiferrales bacterium]
METDTDKLLSFELHAVMRPERRGEFRESRRVAVEISGFDARGRFFTERTFTTDVSDSGCSFLLNAEVEKHRAVSVRVIRRRNGMMQDDPPVIFRVARVEQTYPGWPKWTVAAAKLHPVKLWTLCYPMDADKAARASSDSLDPLDSPNGEPPAT